MKVGIVTTFANSTGGVQTFTKDIENTLTSWDHKVGVIGIESLPKTPGKGNVEKEVGEYFNHLNSKENYDVVLCNGEFGYSVSHPRAINVFHGNYLGYAQSVEHLVPREVTEERLRKAEMQRISAEGKYVVSVSKFANKGLEESGIKVDQVIRNSVDASVFYPEKSPIGNHALAVARGGRKYEKGFDILEDLARNGMQIRLFSDVEIDSKNVDNNSFEENENLVREYRKANLLLHPSRFEGGGLVTLEAMASGCPVLTTKVGYGSEIKKVIPEFIVEDLDNTSEYLEKQKIISENRKEFSERSINYFWKFHNPMDFQNEWVNTIEKIGRS